MTKTRINWDSEADDTIAELVKAGLTAAQIAQKLGCTTKQLTDHIWVVRKGGKKDFARRQTGPMAKLASLWEGQVPEQMGNPEGDSCENRIAYWRDQAKKALQLAEKANLRAEHSEVTADLFRDLAPKSYDPLPPAHVHPSGSPGSEQSALLMFSDTHVGQVVRPDQTLGLGAYNFDLFCRRLYRLERSVFSILRDHTTTVVPELVIPILGDMLHGNLQHAAEAGQVNTLMDQFFCAGHVLAQFFQNLATLVPKVRVYTAVGNHTRWGTQKKMPTDNRYSNFDQLLYAYLQALTKNISNIEFNLDKQPFALFDVQGWHFFAGHGDHLRGGDRILGIPAHAIGRQVSAQAQLSAFIGRPVPNYYLFGHLHRGMELPHVNGEVVINGAFPGVDGFGIMGSFNIKPPMQRFFLVHKRFGPSAEYKLRLDLGDNESHHYNLPSTNFNCQ